MKVSSSLSFLTCLRFRILLLIMTMTLSFLHPTSAWATAAQTSVGHGYKRSKGKQTRPFLRPKSRSPLVLPLASSSADVAGSSDRDNSKDKLATWKSKLLQASNWASLLCVLDCTVLPLVTVILPLLGLVAMSPAQMEWLHQLGHAVALGFVLPVGGAATLLNYLYAHRQRRIAALGVCGLVLVAAANAPHSVLHLIKHRGPLLSWLYPVMHAVHHGLLHRATNLLGCACLLGSNYLSHRTGKCLHGHDHSECSDHGHSHSHDHGSSE